MPFSIILIFPISNINCSWAKIEFLKNSKKGEVKISGQESAPGRHAEQPIFAVKNAAGVKLLNGFTPPASEKCTSQPCPKFTMVVFNPCSDDPSSAILGNDYGSV